MIPDINVVRELKHSDVDSKKSQHNLIGVTRFDAIRHFYDRLTSEINDQLMSGNFARCKLGYWDVRSYMQDHLSDILFESIKDTDYFKILDAIFSRIYVNYTHAGYIVYVDKIIHPKANFSSYYSSYYFCEIGF